MKCSVGIRHRLRASRPYHSSHFPASDTRPAARHRKRISRCRWGCETARRLYRNPAARDSAHYRRKVQVTQQLRREISCAWIKFSKTDPVRPTRQTSVKPSVQEAETFVAKSDSVWHKLASLRRERAS